MLTVVHENAQKFLLIEIHVSPDAGGVKSSDSTPGQCCHSLSKTNCLLLLDLTTDGSRSKTSMVEFSLETVPWGVLVLWVA